MPGRGDHQAQQPVRRVRRRRRRSRPTSKRARDRPGLAPSAASTCFNRKVDARASPRSCSKIFVELVFAPGYDDDALEILTPEGEHPDPRRTQERRNEPIGEHDIRRVRGGLLIQDRNADIEMRDEMHVVTERAPDRGASGASCCSPGRSASTCARTRSCWRRTWRPSGIGAGQMSRVDSVRIAVDKARAPLDGAAMASDAFFPFADGPQVAIDAGVQRDHPARRLEARPGGHRRLQRGAASRWSSRRAGTSGTRPAPAGTRRRCV